MDIRRLGPDDAAKFHALRLRGLLECPAAFTSSHEEEVGLSLEIIAARLAPKPDGAVFGCFVTAELAGVIGVQRDPHRKLKHKAFIWGMYVAPAHRRLGVGRALVAAALDHATGPLGVTRVNLGVNSANHAARALYESSGFTTYGIEPGFMLVDGMLHDEHLMTWVRDPA